MIQIAYAYIKQSATLSLQNCDLYCKCMWLPNGKIDCQDVQILHAFILQLSFHTIQMTVFVVSRFPLNTIINNLQNELLCI